MKRQFMGRGVRLQVEGERALFTRPEFKAERMSYPFITPSAARGILEAIHWKPAIRWEVRKIHVLNPIKWQSFRRNEVGKRMGVPSSKNRKEGDLSGLGLDIMSERQQRASLILTDVAYVIEAEFYLTKKAGREDSEAKHISIFNRRAEKGQCFQQPCFGAREFPCSFTLLPEGADIPNSALPEEDRNRDFGLMVWQPPYDSKGGIEGQEQVFRAKLQGGILEVPSLAQLTGKDRMKYLLSEDQQKAFEGEGAQ